MKIKILADFQIYISVSLIKIKENKNWTSRTLATPPSTPYVRHLIFVLTSPPTSPQSGRHMCITPNLYKLYDICMAYRKNGIQDHERTQDPRLYENPRPVLYFLLNTVFDSSTLTFYILSKTPEG